MKIVAISDTHGRKIPIPDGDILIHAGDFTSTGQIHEIVNFNTWLGKLPHPKKIVCAGNHDMFFERDYHFAKSLLTNATYLQDDLIEFEGKKIYCSPWTPTFCNWAFMRDRGQSILQKWVNIPAGIDILVTHGPPWGILDTIGRDTEHLGCVDLYNEVTTRVKPKIHIFGHIHGGQGRVEKNDILFVNASICDEAYVAINKPIDILF